jgi:short-subunit dehydrogenase
MLSNKFAVVTGSGSGIGAATARVFVRENIKGIAIVDYNYEAACKVAEELGPVAFPVKCDVSNAADVEAAIAQIMERFGRVDILVNNAGVFFFNEYVKTDLKRIELMLNLHIKTVSKMCWYFGQDMKERGFGYILNMSSMSAWMTMPGINVYNASKAFILNFSRSLWYELMPHGVSVTAVCPGAVDTGLYGLSDYWRKIAVGLGVSMKPEKLAEKALKKMYKKEKQYLPGWINHLFVPLIKHLPDFLIFFIIKKIKCFQK